LRRIEVHFGRWQTRRLSDVSREEVGRVQLAIARQHGRVASNRALTLLRAVFNWGKAAGIFAGDNPAVGLEFYPEQKRERFLSPEELRRVNDALIEEPNEYWRGYFALALLLGTRKNELLAARWECVDLDQQTLRIPQTKAGRSHTLPLPESAAAILRSLPSCGTSEWIFPGIGKSGHLVEAKSAWQRCRNRAGVPDCTIHDLRRTLGSWLAGAGFSLPMIGRALNHSNVASTQIYARLDLTSVRAALEQNSQMMRLGVGQ
jgi:integrase